MRSIWFVLVLAIVILLAGLETVRASPQKAASAYYGKTFPFISAPALVAPASSLFIDYLVSSRIRLTVLPDSANLTLAKTTPSAIVRGTGNLTPAWRNEPAQAVIPSARSGPQYYSRFAENNFWYSAPAIVASATSSAKRNARDTGDRR